MSFTVCQYNIGSNARDYGMLCAYKDSSVLESIHELAEDESFQQKMAQVEEAAARVLLRTSADVYFLEEVGSPETRVFITHLNQKKRIYID